MQFFRGIFFFVFLLFGFGGFVLFSYTITTTMRSTPLASVYLLLRFRYVGDLFPGARFLGVKQGMTGIRRRLGQHISSIEGTGRQDDVGKDRIDAIQHSEHCTDWFIPLQFTVRSGSSLVVRCGWRLELKYSLVLQGALAKAWVILIICISKSHLSHC